MTDPNTATEVFEFPSTPTQQSLWFVQRIDADSTAYNIPLAFRVRGPLDEAQLRQAFETLVARHEILRTVFREREGALVQRVVSAMPLDWASTAVDTGNSGGSGDFTSACRELAAAEAARHFDLEAGPLLRVRLMRRSADDALLVAVLHHIVIDHLSLAQCMREVGASYEALRGGVPDEGQAEPALQFADYSVWLHENASADDLARKTETWRRRLEGFSGVLDLPTDYPRPALSHGAGAQQPLRFDAALSARAQQFARREGVSLFTVLLAALKVLMHRYSGQEDIIIGTPFANRAGQDDLEQVVGCFINTLPIASQVRGTATFRELLAAVKATMLEAVELQDTPLGTIVDAVKPRRDPGRNPLFQVGFVLQAPPVALKLAGLELEDLQVHSGGAMYDLHFWLWEGTAGTTPCIEGMAWYATALYDDSTIARLAEHFQHVLAEVLAAPDSPLAHIGFAPPADGDALAAWQGEAVAWPAGTSVVGLLEAAGQHHAGRPAIDGPQGLVHHGELHARVAAVARGLQQRGVGPGSLVGLCLPRDVDMVVALLAILKTGAAYVPMDPDFPAQRLAHMASDSRLAWVVTTQALEGVLGWPGAPATVRIEDLPMAGGASAWPVIDPESPAYVIYTSGSSGQPKGVAVPHRSVVNFLRSMAREPGLAETDRLLAVTTLSFDIAVLELLLPLSVGALVVLASSAQTRDGAALRRLLEERHVTVMQATPGTWRMLLHAGWPGRPGLTALVGGEPLPPDLATTLLGMGITLWNMYGPTETTVWSTLWKVAPHAQGISIGRPIANTQVHVLDDALRVCPIGTPGEICIGGDGVALGYLHQPALTAERFVPDPLSARPGALLYRTGDRGRWQGHGLLQHLGRLDQQVKVRGYRIELGEIEAALLTHPHIEACVVATRESTPGEVSIVAYAVSRGTLPAAAELREHLRATLPEYMVAQQFISVPAIPHLPNGKVDRRALDAFWHPPASAAAAHAPKAPPTPAELAVTEVWQSFLGRVQVYPADNFFDLGGNSLQAMQAAAAMEQRLGVHIDLRRMIFESMGQLAATQAVPVGVAAGGVAGPETLRKPGLFGRLAGALRPAAKRSAGA